MLRVCPPPSAALTQKAASCLAAGAQPEDPGSLPRLSDTAAASLFAGTTSSKAMHVSQRQTDTDTHGHTSRTLTRPVTDTATDKALLSAAPTQRAHIKHKHSQPCLLLLLLGWRRPVSSAGAHTTLSRLTSTHTFVVASSTGKAPLPTRDPCPHPGPLTHPRVPSSLAGPARCRLPAYSTPARIPQAVGGPPDTSMDPPPT